MGALVAAAGFRSSTGALLEPLEADFGWSRATTSGAVSLNLIVYGLTAPVRGRADGALRGTPGGRRRAGPGRRRLRPHPGHDQRLAAVAAVGLRGRDRHRLAGPGLRRDRGQPLVRPAPRPGDRGLLRRQLDRPAGLPARHRAPRRGARLAVGGRAGRRRSRSRWCRWCWWILRDPPADVGTTPYGAGGRTGPDGAGDRDPRAPAGGRGRHAARERALAHVLDPVRARSGSAAGRPTG